MTALIAQEAAISGLALTCCIAIVWPKARWAMVALAWTLIIALIAASLIGTAPAAVEGPTAELSSFSLQPSAFSLVPGGH